MMNCKKTLLSIALLLVSLAAGADTGTSLVVLMKNGNTSTFELATKPKVTFDATNLMIHTVNEDVSIPLTDIVRYWFEINEATGITEKDADKSAIDYKDGALVLNGLKAGTEVHVYDADGREVQAMTARHDGTSRLSLSQLPTGVYIVKLNSTTYKITKR